MENPNVLTMTPLTRKKTFKLVKSGALGGLVFGFVYLTIIWMNMTGIMKSTEGTDLSALLVSIPPELIRQAIGSEHFAGFTFKNYLVFDASVNVILGALVFSSITALFQLGTNEENDHTS